MSPVRAPVAALALALFACSGEDDTPPPVCSSLGDDVPPTDFVWSPGTLPPEATGGVPRDGVYYLAEDQIHGADAECGEQVELIEVRTPYARQALRITAESDTTGAMELVTVTGTDALSAWSTYVVVDTTLSFASSCGSTSVFPEGVPFTVDGDDFWVFPPLASCGPRSSRYTRVVE